MQAMYNVMMPIQGSAINKESKETFETFFKSQSLKEYKKGEKVLRPSDIGTYVFYIKSGFVKIYLVSKSGKEIIINIINGSQYNYLVFGVGDFMKDYSIETLTDVQAMRFSKELFMDFIKDHPEAYAELLRPLTRSLKSAYDQIKWIKNGNASFKIASVIHYLGKETATSEKNKVTIGFRITHQMIANLTGLTRETVTVQLNKLRDKGFIEYNDNILTINNVKDLAHKTEL